MNPGEKLHRNAQETERRNYDRLRQEGASPEAAREIAKDAARETHEKLDRRK
jgi:hypothetical protein